MDLVSTWTRIDLTALPIAANIGIPKSQKVMTKSLNFVCVNNSEIQKLHTSPSPPPFPPPPLPSPPLPSLPPTFMGLNVEIT